MLGPIELSPNELGPMKVDPYSCFNVVPSIIRKLRYDIIGEYSRIECTV